MKKLIACLFLFPFALSSQSKKINVLFLGNSYTYVNNLPQLVYNIALANGDTLVYDSNLIGGYSLNNHFMSAASLAKINASPWDVVVLQAQSQEPSFPPAQVAAQVFPYAMKLDSAIKQNNPCSITAYYETWGRKYGDASNCAAYPPLCTYTGMQDRLKESYLNFTNACNGIMAPVGEAFRSSVAASPTLELYDPDQSHPSLNGSYLAAAVFYETLFHKSVVGNAYTPNLPAGTLAFLQQTAHAVVNDSLAVWGLGRNTPWAAFTPSLQAPGSYQFQTQSPLLGNTWYFGDGAISTQANPQHQYPAGGTYTVSHVVSDSCRTDSMIRVIQWIPTGWPAHGVREAGIAAYPDPCTDRLHLSAGAGTEGAAVELYDASGRLLARDSFKAEMATGHLSNGVYVLKVYAPAGPVCLRFIKNE